MARLNFLIVKLSKILGVLMNKFFYLLILTSFSCFAWGPTGHRVVGVVAQKNLTPKTLEKINAILKGDSLAKVANWPDEIKSEPQTYSQTFSWHYTQWPDQNSEHQETELTGLLLTYIKFHLDYLRSDAKPEEKAFSLKFLVHLVGDLHQPYHVGNGVDKGGNACKVIFFNTQTNLHKVWDEDMIDSTKLSFTEIADFILQGVGSEKIRLIQQGSLIDWTKESKEIRSVAYPNEVNPNGQTQQQNQDRHPKTYCASEVAVELMPKMSYDYNYKFMPQLNRRLLEGGLRLAMVLNQVLDGNTPTQSLISKLK